MAENFAAWSVIELCRGYGPATVAGKLLADLGCAVVKVEGPEGDPLRDDPAARGGGLSVFELVSASKDSVCIDVGHETADGPLAALLRGAEVALIDGEGWRTLQDRFGEPERIRARFPSLTIAVLTHLGMEGPLASWQANVRNRAGSNRSISAKWKADGI